MIKYLLVLIVLSGCYQSPYTKEEILEMRAFEESQNNKPVEISSEEKTKLFQDYINETGEFANRELIKTIQAESHRTNINLIQLGNQQQRLLNRFK